MKKRKTMNMDSLTVIFIKQQPWTSSFLLDSKSNCKMWSFETSNKVIPKSSNKKRKSQLKSEGSPQEEKVLTLLILEIRTLTNLLDSQEETRKSKITGILIEELEKQSLSTQWVIIMKLINLFKKSQFSKIMWRMSRVAVIRSFNYWGVILAFTSSWSHYSLNTRSLRN